MVKSKTTNKSADKGRRVFTDEDITAASKAEHQEKEKAKVEASVPELLTVDGDLEDAPPAELLYCVPEQLSGWTVAERLVVSAGFLTLGTICYAFGVHGILCLIE